MVTSAKLDGTKTLGVTHHLAQFGCELADLKSARGVGFRAAILHDWSLEYCLLLSWDLGCTIPRDLQLARLRGRVVACANGVFTSSLDYRHHDREVSRSC